MVATFLRSQQEPRVLSQFSQDENMINVQYKDLTGENVEAVFSYEMIDDELYIISEYADEQMYWTKLAE